MDSRRIVQAGLIAGVLLNLFGWLGNAFLLREAWREAVPRAPLAQREKTEVLRHSLVSLIPDFVYGIALAWLYVAVQPRLKPGMGTAMKAALLIWAVGVMTTYVGIANSGLLPAKLSMATSLLALVSFLPAAWVVHRFSNYKSG